MPKNTINQQLKRLSRLIYMVKKQMPVPRPVSSSLLMLLLLSQVGPRPPQRRVSDLPLGLVPKGFASFGMQFDGVEHAAIDLKITQEDLAVLEGEFGKQEQITEKLSGNQLEQYNQIHQVLRRHFKGQDYETIADGAERFSPVHIAAYLGDIAQLKYYLQYYDVNAVARTGSTPLLLALVTNNKPMVMALLTAGADPFFSIDASNNTYTLAKRIVGDNNDFAWAFKLFEDYQPKQSAINWFYVLLAVSVFIPTVYYLINQFSQLVCLFTSSATGKIDPAPVSTEKQLDLTSFPVAIEQKKSQPKIKTQRQRNSVAKKPERKVTTTFFEQPKRRLPVFNKKLIPAAAWDLLRKLVNAGFIVDIAGGAVVAALLGHDPNDIDIVLYTSDIAKIQTLITENMEIQKTSEFTSIKLNYQGVDIDMTLTTKNRRQFFANYDFTLHVLVYNVNQDKLIDAAPAGKNSNNDFIDGIIRTVRPASCLLQEPRLLLRMVRLKVKVMDKLTIDAKILSIISECKQLRMPSEQLSPELAKCFLRGCAVDTTQLMQLLDLFYKILPNYSRIPLSQRERANFYLLDMAKTLDKLYSEDGEQETFSARRLPLMLTMLLGIPLKIQLEDSQALSARDFFASIKQFIVIPKTIQYGSDSNQQTLLLFQEYISRCFFAKTNLYVAGHDYTIAEQFFQQTVTLTSSQSMKPAYSNC